MWIFNCMEVSPQPLNSSEVYCIWVTLSCVLYFVDIVSVFLKNFLTKFFTMLISIPCFCILLRNLAYAHKDSFVQVFIFLFQCEWMLPVFSLHLRFVISGKLKCEDSVFCTMYPESGVLRLCSALIRNPGLSSSFCISIKYLLSSYIPFY